MATDLFLTHDLSDLDTASIHGLVANINTRGGGVNAAGAETTTVAGPTAGVHCTNGPGGQTITWWTPPLSGITISGTVTVNVWAGESNMNANAGMHCRINRVSGSGAFISTIVNSERGVELGTTGSAQNWTATPTSTTLATGDRLEIVFLINDAGGNMGSGFFVLVFWGSVSSGTNGDSWVRTTENLTAFTATPIAASDSLTVAATEAGQLLAPIAASESLTVAVIDTVPPAQIVASDSLTVAVTDAGQVIHGSLEAVTPNKLLNTQGLAYGAVTDIDEDPASPDVLWLDGTSALDLRIAFGSPSSSLVNIPQEFRVRLRPPT